MTQPPRLDAGRLSPEARVEYRATLSRYEAEVRPFFAAGKIATFTGSSRAHLRYVCLPAKTSLGALVFLPGKGEPGLKYAELAYDLRLLGLSLYILDHRGMGHSDRLLPDRRKVHVEKFDDYVEDLRLFLDTVVQPAGHRRIALLAHSTGALIAARLLEQYPGRVSAAVLCSAAFELHVGPLPAWLVRLLARGLDRPGKAGEYGPGQERFERIPFRDNVISQSLARWQLWEERLPAEQPETVLGGVTRRWLRETTAAGRLALQRAAAVRDPVLVLVAGKDRVVRPGAQRRFCRRCPTCAALVLPEARHEILIEADGIRDLALARIGSFLHSRMPEADAG